MPRENFSPASILREVMAFAAGGAGSLIGREAPRETRACAACPPALFYIAFFPVELIFWNLFLSEGPVFRFGFFSVSVSGSLQEAVFYE